MSPSGGAAVVKSSRLVRATGKWLRRLPFKPMLFITVACLAIKEQYPFSNFPMYSSFGDSTYYVYLADGEDRPLPTYAAAGMSTPKLKKVFANELRQERKRAPASRKPLLQEHKRAAGERVLARLKEAAGQRKSDAPAPAVWRLYEVNISLVDGRYEKQRNLIAEFQ